MKELITGVALFDGERNCIVISMSKPFRHGSLFVALEAARSNHFHEDPIDTDPQHFIQGFITSTGRFIDRVKARELAIENGQFIARKDNANFRVLFSEDIW